MVYPAKIICLTEESVETLFWVGKGDLIKGVSKYVERPIEATKLPVVSAFTKSNIDEIVAKKADLILGYSDIQKDIAKELVEKGQNVFIANHQSLDGILNYIYMLGNLVDAKPKTSELIELCHQKMNEAKKFAQDMPAKPKVYFEEWDNPLISSIKWVTELLELCGGEVIFSNNKEEHLAKDRIVSHEEIRARNPDIFLACWCGKKVKMDKIYNRDGYKDIAAIKHQQVFELNPAIYLQPGPAPFLTGIDEILSIYSSWLELDTKK